MIDFINCNLGDVIVHQVGNRTNDEDLIISENEVCIKDNPKLRELLIKYFLYPFRNKKELYSFTFADENISLNPLYQYSKSIFEDSNDFIKNSTSIAKLLYEKSTHQKIKSGDLFVVTFKNIALDSYFTDAIGVFKSENSQDFLKLIQKNKSIDLSTDKGIDINKLDKGCLIFNINEDNGYVMSIIDNVNKESQAQYWKDDFLNVKILNNNYNQTNQLMGVAKQFITKKLGERDVLNKADQIDLLNRSANYFKNNDEFNMGVFESEIFSDRDLIDAFRKFNQTYKQENDIELEDSFEISSQAVNKQARGFRKVLKLDKNFHIYIHGNRELIEQGVDERGRKYYKIYYEEES